jgi:group I intron endonuclease
MFIYKIDFPNGKVYIGQTGSLAARQRGHSDEARKGNCRPVYNAIRKYFKEDLTLRVIDTAETWEELDEKEIAWIAHFDSTNPERGYNLTRGGHGNLWSSMTEEQRERSKEKWRSKMVGRPGTMSLEAIAKRNSCSIEEARKLTPNYGKPRSDYVKKRASVTHKGKTVSTETRRKQSESHCQYEYRLCNVSTGERVATVNLHQWCKERGLPYGTLVRRSQGEQGTRRQAEEWDVERMGV